MRFNRVNNSFEWFHVYIEDLFETVKKTQKNDEKKNEYSDITIILS